MEKKQELGVEEAFRQLEELTQDMERENITLEESFQRFEQGMKLVKKCNSLIQEVEKKMIVLSEEE